MRVLVTGGAGYIGSVVTEQLAAAGLQPQVLDDLSAGHRAAVPPGVPLHVADLGDRAAVDEVMARVRPDAIMHFAGRSIVGESMDPVGVWRYLEGNVTQGLNLVQSMIAHGVRRFILSSTAALFGEPGAAPVAEDAPIRPGNPYGESKHALERILAWTDAIHGVRYASLRYGNAAGASEARGEDHDPETHLIPLVLQVALGRRGSITVLGDDHGTPDGTCVRDYVHVSDLAQAHILALSALDRGSRIYNLGTGRGSSVLEVIAAVRRVTGHPVPYTVGARRVGDPAVLSVDSERIQRELAWQPRWTQLDAIVASAWRWHARHPDGYSE